jgi:hypothetical protein
MSVPNCTTSHPWRRWTLWFVWWTFFIIFFQTEVQRLDLFSVVSVNSLWWWLLRRALDTDVRNGTVHKTVRQHFGILCLRLHARETSYTYCVGPYCERWGVWASWSLGLYVTKALLNSEDQATAIFRNVGSFDSRPKSSAARLWQPQNLRGTSLIDPEGCTWRRWVSACTTSNSFCVGYMCIGCLVTM